LRLSPGFAPNNFCSLTRGATKGIRCARHLWSYGWTRYSHEERDVICV
jgi:hypothetical protein